MAKEFGRNRRVADLIQRELANLMERERDDSEFSLLTISNVDVSPDLKNAKVFVTCLAGENKDTEPVSALSEKAWHFRQHLARSLNMRGVPKLKFIYDHNLERANRVTALIDSLKSEEHRENGIGENNSTEQESDHSKDS